MGTKEGIIQLPDDQRESRSSSLEFREFPLSNALLRGNSLNSKEEEGDSLLSSGNCIIPSLVPKDNF